MIRVVAVVVCYAAVVRAAFSTNYEQGPLIKNGVPVDTPEVQAAKELHFKLYAQAKELADKQPSDGRYEGKEEKYHQSNAIPEVDDKKKYYSSVIKDVDGQKKYYHTAVENHHQTETSVGTQGEYKQYVQYYSVPIPTHYSYPEYTESKVPISTNTNYEHQYQEYSLENKVPISTKTNYDQQYQEYPVDSKVPVSTQANYDQYSGYSTSPQTSTTPLHQQHYEYRTKRDLYYQPHDLYQEIAITPYITRPTFEEEKGNNENDIEYQYHHHREHIPVITKAGVPEETPAVKAAREQHHLAHHLAKTGASYTGGWSKYRPVMAPNGVPYDTPEVYREKLRHLAAHQEAEAKHHKHHEHHGHHHDYEEQEEEEQEQEQEQEEY